MSLRNKETLIKLIDRRLNKNRFHEELLTSLSLKKMTMNQLEGVSYLAMLAEILIENKNVKQEEGTS
jgi:hypothetical protein